MKEKKITSSDFDTKYNDKSGTRWYCPYGCKTKNNKPVMFSTKILRDWHVDAAHD